MLTENHPVIRIIQNSEELDDYDKLLALNSLLVEEEFNESDLLASMFVFRRAELGYEFWSDINYILKEKGLC